jgi:hypothetical protein
MLFTQIALLIRLHELSIVQPDEFKNRIEISLSYYTELCSSLSICSSTKFA